MLNRSVLALALGLAALPLVTTSVGCAKKAEPVAEPDVNYQITLGKAELVRQQLEGVEERNSLRYLLRFTNGLKGPAVIDKIEFTYGIGDRELGSETVTPKQSVAVGDTGTVYLVGQFEWRTTSELPGQQATLKGTVYWTGPNGNARTSPFEFAQAYEDVSE